MRQLGISPATTLPTTFSLAPHVTETRPQVLWTISSLSKSGGSSVSASVTSRVTHSPRVPRFFAQTTHRFNYTSLGKTTPTAGKWMLTLAARDCFEEETNFSWKQNLLELLIKWKGLTEDDATWEEEKQIVESFLEFVCNLEDKDALPGRGINGPAAMDHRNERPVRIRRPNLRYKD